MEGAITYYNNYSPVGDVLVLAIGCVFAILIRSAFISKNKNFTLLRIILTLIMVAAGLELFYNVALNSIDSYPHVLIYVLRTSYYVCLFGNLFLYVLYAMIPLCLDEDVRKRYVILSVAVFIAASLYRALGFVFKYGFYISDDGEIHEGINIFIYVYIIYVGILLFILFRYRNRIAKQIINGIIGAYAVAILVIGVQNLYNQCSFTTATFLMPAFALLYLVHSNPYDIELGAVNVSAFEDMISYSYNHNKELLLVSLFMHEYEGRGKKYPVEIQQMVRHLSNDFFKEAVLFQITNGRMIVVVDIAKNPSYENSINHMLTKFDEVNANSKLEFKINITKTVNEISEINDYVGLISYVESGMKEKDVYFIESKDVENYFEHKYILTELEDINNKKDLNDSRVEVYCQPVLNILTGKYDTAEALMRLNLEKVGMVFPNQFIPLAEENGYIHTLSRIILNKTCEHIKSMMDCSYIVKRISVNFAVSEVRDEDFCKDINDIIKKSGIPYEKIAVEITESQNESDFCIMKEKINELRQHGIKFYLDDFGTGYSNFERIMELPFDIIKFDRSLVLACGTDYKSQRMVYYLAKMFSDMQYSVLYEGVETMEDEEKCRQMCANYLQGYKYSKPIPIEKLTEYFEKESA